VIDPISCDVFKRLPDGTIMIEVDRVKIFLKREGSPGIVEDLVLKSTNYNLKCRIECDQRKGKVILVECIGFKADKVKQAIEDSMRKAGMLYNTV